MIRLVHAPRRETVRYDRASRLLTVGEHAAVIEPSTDGDGNETLLRTYLELVARSRGVVLGAGMQLRDDDIHVLAQVLDLDDAALTSRLSRMLGVSMHEAKAVRGRIARRRLLVGAASLGVGVLASVPFVGGRSEPPTTMATTATTAVTTTTVAATTTTTAVTATTAAVTEATATTAPMPSVDIGTALVIERGTQPADPNTQIGDTVTYER